LPALIWLSYLSLVVLSLLDNVRGPFYPDILRDLQLNDARGSLFWAVMSLCAFIGSSTSHRIVHRHSSLLLLSGSCALIACGYGAIAFAHSLTGLLPFCALFGFGYGGLNLAQNVMIFEVGEPTKRRRLFAGLHSMYAMAAFLAPAIASLLRWIGADWRDGFKWLAFLPLALTFVSWGFRAKGGRRPMPTAAPRLDRSEKIACTLFSMVLAGYLWGEISISTRIVEMLRDGAGYSPDRANFFLGAFCLMLFGGRVLFSFRHFPLDNWSILRISGVLSAVAYVLALSLSPWWFAVCGLCMSPFYPLAMEQVSLSFGRKSAPALGLIIGAGSLSVVALHVTIGLLTDAVGITHALYVGPASLLLAVGLLFAILPRLSRTAVAV
jgi:fucose permease